MIGHTGILSAAIRAVEAVDENLRRVVEKVWELGGVALVTSDHGNAELMVDPETGEPHTAHTTNPVPLIFADPAGKGLVLKEDRALEDLAPTLLHLLNIPLPPEMTGEDLRKR
jgi:2,3-bisphosphoglycerate-independent phosphoglycerate mutase